MLLADRAPLNLQRQRAVIDLAPRTAEREHLPDLRYIRAKLKPIGLHTFHATTLERVVNKDKAAPTTCVIHPRPKGRGLSRKFQVIAAMVFWSVTPASSKAKQRAIHPCMAHRAKRSGSAVPAGARSSWDEGARRSLKLVAPNRRGGQYWRCGEAFAGTTRRVFYWTIPFNRLDITDCKCCKQCSIQSRTRRHCMQSMPEEF